VSTGRTPADQFSPPGEAETVDGIGDKAYFLKANNELHVLHGDIEIYVLFSKDNGPYGDLTLIPGEKAIAAKVLETIGA
jgi:hypothetical protein